MKRSQTLGLAALLAGVLAMAGCARNAVWKRQTFAFATPPPPVASGSRTNLVALGSVTISPLFKGQSFTYRTAEDTYEQDPYAEFLAPPDRMLAEAIRAWLRNTGALGIVVEPESGLTPSLIVEVSISELDGDFRNPAKPEGAMAIHFTIYKENEDGPGALITDKVCAFQTPLASHSPAALMAAWDADLRQIMDQIDSEYAKANLNDR
jgi:uncharacterized lipoprotein YmbA